MLIKNTTTNSMIESKYFGKADWRQMFSYKLETSNGTPLVNADEIKVLREHGYIIDSAPRPVTNSWQDEPATSAQRNYLTSLRVKLELALTKGRASQLIDAAKRGELGSVGGFYIDGSN